MTVPMLFDAGLRNARMHRRAPDAFLQRQLEDRALDRVRALTIAPETIAISGYPSPDFLHDLASLFPYASIEQAALEHEKLVLETAPNLFIDLGESALLNDLPGFLIQIRGQLAPDGKFVSVFYGGNSLQAFRSALITAETNIRGGAAPRLHPTIPLESAIALLQRTGFASPVADRETLNVTYKSIHDLARDLRAARLGNQLAAQSRAVPPRRLFKEAERLWLAGAERTPATFEIITMTGWQKPA